MPSTPAPFATLCIDEAEMTPQQDAVIRALLCECFGDDAGVFSHTRAWHGSGPEFTLAYFEEGRALGHVGVVVREIACDGRPVRIAGVQNVAVTPSRRRTGLARQLMQDAMREAGRRGLPYGVLFCVPALERFYHSVGWHRLDLPATMLHHETGAEIPTDPKNILMIKELGGEPFAARSVHLQGADW